MTKKWNRPLAPLAVLVVTSMPLVMTGCAIDPELVKQQATNAPQSANEGLRRAREQKLNDEWRGKTYKELVKKRGMPSMTMHATRKGGPPSTAFVYDNGGDGTGCIDAFVVVQGVGTVADYFCR